jgi:hypothetical protein
MSVISKNPIPEFSRKDISVQEMTAHVERLIRENPTLSTIATPVAWIMDRVMRELGGGWNPVQLRPFVTAKYYRNNAVPYVLQLAMQELATMRLYLTEEQQADLDEVESTINEAIRVIEQRHKSAE